VRFRRRGLLRSSSCPPRRLILLPSAIPSDPSCATPAGGPYLPSPPGVVNNQEPSDDHDCAANQAKLYRILGRQVRNVEPMRAIPCVLWRDHYMVGKGAMRLDASDRPVGNFAVRNKPCCLKIAGELYDFDRQLAAFLMKQWTRTCSTLSEASGARRSYSVVPQAPTRSTWERSALVRSRQKIRKASNREPAPSHAGTLPQSRSGRLAEGMAGDRSKASRHCWQSFWQSGRCNRTGRDATGRMTDLTRPAAMPTAGPGGRLVSYF
jgi:hypothetical protein